jgi:NADH dehydrogenase [ubiquinone] 1 alpha subcomplex assembly factor 7
MRLKSRIAALIEAQGPMSVAQFMTIALLDPQDGYYITRDPIGAPSLSKGGDFTTAPEVSQMFGEMVGLWLVQAWADQGCPKNPRLVELGPGRGTLMADILRAAAVAPEFLADLDVVRSRPAPSCRRSRRKNCATAARIFPGRRSSTTASPTGPCSWWPTSSSMPCRCASM